MILLGPPDRIASTKNAKELHRFAKKIGLKRKCYKKLNEDGSRGYYNITSKYKLLHAIGLKVQVIEDDRKSMRFWKDLTT